MNPFSYASSEQFWGFYPYKASPSQEHPFISGKERWKPAALNMRDATWGGLLDTNSVSPKGFD